MKIAFWSNTNGRSGTTSNLACLSVMCTMMQHKKTVLFENHCSINNLEHIFIDSRTGTRSILREQYSYFDQTGLESLIKRIHSNHTYEDIIDDISIKFLENHIYYLPRNIELNQEYFEFELNQVIHPLLGYLTNTADFVFIDTASHNNLSTKAVLDEAELVVVNLCQSKQVIEHFFREYPGIEKKSFLLIGNYQPKSLFNLKSIRKCYHIPKSCVGVIPYNTGFHDALSSGTMIGFMQENFTCDPENENFYFMNEVKKTAQLIINAAN